MNSVSATLDLHKVTKVSSTTCRREGDEGKENKTAHHLSLSTAGTQPTDDCPSSQVPIIGLLSEVKDGEASPSNSVESCASKQEEVFSQKSPKTSSAESDSDDSSLKPIKRARPVPINCQPEGKNPIDFSALCREKDEESSKFLKGISHQQESCLIAKKGSSKSAHPTDRMAFQSSSTSQIFLKETGAQGSRSPPRPKLSSRRRISSGMNEEEQWSDSPEKQSTSMVIETTSMSRCILDSHRFNRRDEDEECGPKEKKIIEFLDNLQVTAVDFLEFIKDQQKALLREAFLSHQDDASVNGTQSRPRSNSQQSSLFSRRRIKASGLDFSTRCNSASIRLKQLEKAVSAAMPSHERPRPSGSANGPSPDPTGGVLKIPLSQAWPDHSDRIDIGQKPIEEQDEPEATPMSRLTKVKKRLASRRQLLGFGGMTPEEPASGSLFRPKLESPIRLSKPQRGEEELKY